LERLLKFAEKQGAIIITPNYRLVPEAKGIEILDDIKNFWTWIHDGSLNRAVSGMDLGVEGDLERIVAGGESAGSFLISLIPFPFYFPSHYVLFLGG
jgi:acetyl esterase/lipase